MTRRGRRSVFDRLVRAREALARAKDRGADPWELAELQSRHDAALEAAAEAGSAPELALAPAEYPAPRRPEPPIPLTWVDESGRSRKGEAGRG